MNQEKHARVMAMAGLQATEFEKVYGIGSWIDPDFRDERMTWMSAWRAARSDDAAADYDQRGQDRAAMGAGSDSAEHGVTDASSPASPQDVLEVPLLELAWETAKSLPPPAAYVMRKLCKRLRNTDHLLDQTMRERDARMDFINELLDALLGDGRAEWSTAYGFADAMEDALSHVKDLSAVSAPAMLARIEEYAQNLERGGQDAGAVRGLLLALEAEVEEASPNEEGDRELAADIARWRDAVHKAALVLGSLSGYFLGSSKRESENDQMREFYARQNKSIKEAVNALMDVHDEMRSAAEASDTFEGEAR